MIAAVVRGDYDLNTLKLQDAVGSDSLRMATPEETMHFT